MRTLIKARFARLMQATRSIHMHNSWASAGIYAQAHLYINQSIA